LRASVAERLQWPLPPSGILGFNDFELGGQVMLKKGILAAAATAILMGASANAADIARPVYKAPVIVPAFNWSGFYIGGHAGWGWQKEDATLATLSPALPIIPLGSVFNLEKDGFLGGAQAGINWQPVGTPWVFGIEGQWSWTDSDSSASLTLPGVVVNGFATTNWYATVAGRIGYAWDRSMFYVKGGAAFADVDYSANIVALGTTFVTNTVSDSRTGWMLGVGFEQAFADNWSWKIEYNYMDFATDRINLTVLGFTGAVDIDTDVHVVKAGINYRFGYAKAPVIAKY
jgi:outer membrane immunogenic protein